LLSITIDTTFSPELQETLITSQLLISSKLGSLGELELVFGCGSTGELGVGAGCGSIRDLKLGVDCSCASEEDFLI